MLTSSSSSSSSFSTTEQLTATNSVQPHSNTNPLDSLSSSSSSSSKVGEAIERQLNPSDLTRELYTDEFQKEEKELFDVLFVVQPEIPIEIIKLTITYLDPSFVSHVKALQKVHALNKRHPVYVTHLLNQTYGTSLMTELRRLFNVHYMDMCEKFESGEDSLTLFYDLPFFLRTFVEEKLEAATASNNILDLSRYCLVYANLSGSKFHNPDYFSKQRELLLEELLDTNRRPTNKPINLCYANLQMANLQHVCFDSANLMYANLQMANLRCASLNTANLRFANLRMTNTQYAHFYASVLYETYFDYSNLRNTDFWYSTIYGYCSFVNADLRKANFESLYPQKLSPHHHSFDHPEWVNLRGAQLQRANLRGLELEKLKKEDLVDILKDTILENVDLAFARYCDGNPSILFIRLLRNIYSSGSGCISATWRHHKKAVRTFLQQAGNPGLPIEQAIERLLKIIGNNQSARLNPNGLLYNICLFSLKYAANPNPKGTLEDLMQGKYEAQKREDRVHHNISSHPLSLFGNGNTSSSHNNPNQSPSSTDMPITAMVG